MADYDLGTGRVRALLLAGPIFIMLVAAGSLPQWARPDGMWSLLLLAPLVLGMAVPLGAILGLLPVLFLTKILAILGYRNFGLRHPAIWGLAGGFAVGVWLPWQQAGSSDQLMYGALTATGIASALIARSTLVWHD